MINTLRMLTQRHVHQIRQLHNCFVYRQTELAATTVEHLTIPVSEGVSKPVGAKIEKLVRDISALNLIEVAELSSTLKKKLNLPDAPIMPIGGMMTKAEEEEEVAPQHVQTSFTVKLTAFDDKQKVALIKEIKTLLPGMNLVQAKKFVESAPTVVKADVSKEEADQLKGAISKVGGEIEIV